MSVGVSCCQTCILSWVSHSMCACVSLLMTLHNRRPGSHRPTLTATPVQLTGSDLDMIYNLDILLPLDTKKAYFLSLEVLVIYSRGHINSDFF